MELRNLRGNWDYYYISGDLKSNFIVQNYMTSKLRFRYGKYIFYVNDYPVKENDIQTEKKTIYNVTCPVSGLALISSKTNDESVLRQEVLRVLNLPNFESNYLKTVKFICDLTGRNNPYDLSINVSILTTLL